MTNDMFWDEMYDNYYEEEVKKEISRNPKFAHHLFEKKRDRDQLHNIISNKTLNDLRALTKKKLKPKLERLSRTKRKETLERAIRKRVGNLRKQGAVKNYDKMLRQARKTAEELLKKKRYYWKEKATGKRKSVSAKFVKLNIIDRLYNIKTGRLVSYKVKKMKKKI